MVLVALLAILAVGSRACPPESYEWEAAGVCKDYCPTGVAAINGECQGDSSFSVLESKALTQDSTIQSALHTEFPYEVDSLVLAPSHQGEFWLRAFETKAGCLWSKGDLSLCFTPEQELQLTVAGRSITGGKVNSLESVLIQYSLHYKELGTFLSLSVDEELVASELFPNLLFNDSKEEKLVLGADFQGQMLEVTAYNGVTSETRKLAACPANCGRCTRQGVCVQRCSPSQYWDASGACLSCPPGCTGCYRGTDCILNTDPLCNPSVYAVGKDLQEHTSCSTCTSYAAKSGNKCACVEGAKFSYINYVPTCTCTSPYLSDSINGVCYLEGYYYGQGSVSGTFSDDFLSVNFKFSSASNGVTICSNIFDASTFAKLGQNPLCSWSTNLLTLTVKFGLGATLLHTDTATFNPDYVQYSPGTGAVKSKSRDVFTSTISLPSVVPDPTAVITAPQEYSLACDDLVISGLDSYNNYGRELTYSWTFTSTEGAPLLSGFSAGSASQALITIPHDSLHPGTMTITLKVTTFFLTSSTASTTLTITGGDALPVIIEGGDRLTAYKTQETKVKASIRRECARNRNVGFYWMFNSASPYTPVLDYKGILQAAADSAYLLIKPKMLLANFTYWFTAYAYDKNDDTVVGSKSFRLDMPWDQLQIFFDKGAGGTFYYNNDLTITANVTDSDEQLEALAYAWTCTIPESGKACYSPLLATELLVPATATTNTITIPATKLQQHGNYTFALQVTKPSWNRAVYRSFQSSLTMRAQNVSSPIATAVSYPTKPVGGRNVIILQGAVVGTDAPTYLWSQTAGASASIVSALNTYYLVVRDLAPGNTFMFTMAVNLNGTAISTINFPVTVSSAPQGGSFIVSPTTAFELNQTISLQARNWADSNLPISYEYRYIFASKTRQIRSESPVTDINTVLPYGATEVDLVVCDVLGSCVTVTQNMTILKLPDAQRQAIDIAAEYAYKSQDKDIIPGLICLYSDAFSLSYELTMEFIDELTEYYKAQYHKDQTTVTILLNALTAIIDNSGAANLAERRAVFDLIRLVANLAEQRLTDTQVVTMHTIASAVTSEDSIGEPMTGYADIDSLLQTISANRGLYQLPYEVPLDVTTTAITARYSRQTGTAFNGTTVTLGTAQVTFPVDLFSNVEEVTPDSVIDLLVTTYPTYTSAQNIYSTIVSFQFTLAGTYKGISLTNLPAPTVIKLDDLTTPITVVIPRTTSDYVSTNMQFYTLFQCVYHTPSGKWSTSGCDLQSISTTAITVSAKHASSFAIQDKTTRDVILSPVPSEIAPGVIVPCDKCGTILTPIWFLIIIFCLSVILAVYGVVKDKVDARKYGDYDFSVLRAKGDQQALDKALRERPVDPWYVTFWKGHLFFGGFWHYRADLSRWARFLIVGVSLIAEECILGVLYWKIKDGPDSGCGRAIFQIYHDMGPTDAFLVFIAIITWTPFTILLVLLFHHLKTFANSTLYGLRVALACVLLFVFFGLGTAGVVELSLEMCAWTSVTWTFSFIYLMIAEIAVTHTGMALVRTFLVRCSQTAWRADAQ